MRRGVGSRWWVFLAGVVVAASVGVRPALACGPFFPNQLVTEGDAAVLRAPAADLGRELARIELPTSLVAIPSDDPFDQTARGAVADLEHALSDLGTPMLERASLLGWYADVRTRLREVAAANARGTGDTPPALPSLDAARLRQLPREFREYLVGALEYHAGHPDDARRRWKRVVEAAPAARRTYRATWAAFMVGRSLVDDRPDAAILWFHRVRELARDRARHADRLGLAAASLGWEARAELERGRAVRAIQLYLEQHKTGSQTARSSLIRVCRRALQGPLDALRTLARNEISRRVVTAYLVWSRADADGWLVALEAVDGADIPDADRLAWAAYQRGALEAAGRWLGRARGSSPVAQWIRAKLLLREGKVAEAATALAQVSRSFPQDEVWSTNDVVESLGYYGWNRRCTPSARAMAELGVLRLARCQFTEALDALARSGFWLDAAYVAERVLTVGELKAYVDRAWPATSDTKTARRGASERTGARLRYLLARRLTRRGRGEEARGYLPRAVRPDLESYLRALRAGADRARPKGERADALWTAARLARHRGMELLGTELAPDWFEHDGRYAPADVASERPPSARAPLTGSSLAEREKAARAPSAPAKRFHYRYLAADHAWRAAKLLSSNTDALARILCEAGSWLKVRDPQAADRFYKALVVRCGETDLGREAAERHWFPKLR